MLKNLETLALNENNLTDLPGTFLIIYFGKHFVDSYDSNKIFIGQVQGQSDQTHLWYFNPKEMKNGMFTFTQSYLLLWGGSDIAWLYVV